MIAHQLSTQDQRSPSAFMVVPATPERALELQKLVVKAYNVSPQAAAQYWSVAMFESRMERFPEGQWFAVDKLTNEILGFTSGMRFEFDSSLPLTETWERTTGYG